jgi:putative hydrolase of the HAD superfamily
VLLTSSIEAVVCDYGGVLTNPLAETFASFETATGVSAAQIGAAMAAEVALSGRHPMAELETGKVSETEFLALLARHMERPPQWLADGFGPAWFAGRTGNAPLIGYLQRLRARGVRLALLTNNVRAWEPLWRATLPVDELFELVVNSAEEGIRKPDPEIYRRTLERLGLAPERCLFLDDLEENCSPARALGMLAVRFDSNEQAIADLERALRGPA